MPILLFEYGMLDVGKVFVDYANMYGVAWIKKNMRGSYFRRTKIDMMFYSEKPLVKNNMNNIYLNNVI